MKRRLAAAMTGALTVAGLLSVGTTPAQAQAGAVQRICSSKNSETTVYLYLANGDYYRLGRSDCETVPLGTRVGIPFDSYKVGYGGPYSECRPGPATFTPWQKATTIYIRTYIDPGC